MATERAYRRTTRPSNPKSTAIWADDEFKKIDQALKALETLVMAGGAPSTAQYLVAATDATLTAERVATNTQTIAWDFATAGQAKASVTVQLSVTSDASGIKLSGDVANPGNNYYYGTNGSGTKGYYALGTAAFKNTGTSGNNVPLLDGVNTWSANQVLQKASPQLHLIASSGDSNFYISAISGAAATARWGTWTGVAFSDRWLFGKDAIAESGANAGSNFAIYGYTDAGGFLNAPLQISRANASVNFGGGIYTNGVTGGQQGAGTANIGTIYESGTLLVSKYARLGSVNTFTANQIILKASANFQVTASSGDGTHYVAAVAGSAATIRWAHYNGVSLVDRWLFGKDATAESGSDAGSNFACYSYTDAGAFKNTIFTCTRAALWNFYATVTFNALTTALINNATNAGVTRTFKVSHTTSGTPGTGIGVGIAFEAETSANNNEVGAAIDAVTTDATAASEDFDLVFSTMAAGAVVAERGRITSKGTYKHQSFTVAGLPAGSAGESCFASNGRKNGEGAGLGTGVLVFHDGTNWIACDSGQTVAA